MKFRPKKESLSREYAAAMGVVSSTDTADSGNDLIYGLTIELGSMMHRQYQSVYLTLLLAAATSAFPSLST